MDKIRSADGTSIAYEKTGSGNPLVLVPGGGANDHRRWDLGGIRSALEKHFTVYAMDGRGLGESGDSAEYELEREFEDVAAVVDATDEPAALLGHSFGGLLALEAALRTGNLYKLVLYEPPLAVGDYKLISGEMVSEMKRLLEGGENEQVLMLFLKEVAKIAPAEIEALRSAPNWPERVKAAHTLPRALQGVGAYKFDPERFKKLAVPTLLLTGSESPPPMKEATKAISAALPNSRIVTFEGHGHVAMNTAPELFIKEILAFNREAN